MADPHPSEDNATLYLLGQLSEVERGEFEARLAASPELRALVRELEDGAVALTHALPQRRPPAQVWENINQAIAAELRPKLLTTAYWLNWLRSGWATAAACLLGWLVYALVVNRPSKGQSPIANETNSVQRSTVAEVTNEEAGHRAAPAIATVPGPRTPQVDSATTTQALGALRWQVAEMSNQMAQMSQTLTQQQAWLADASRMKFFQVSSDSVEGTNAPALSPRLQQALFGAMAKELGWQPAAAAEPKAGTPGTNAPAPNPNKFDFVDFRNMTNSPTPPPNYQTQVSQEPSEPLTAPTSASGTNAIPGFFSGTSMFVAIDGSVVPVGSSLSFWSGGASSFGQWYQPIGSTVLGGDPTVVAIPVRNASVSAWSLTIMATTPSGYSSTLGVYSLPGTAHP